MKPLPKHCKDCKAETPDDPPSAWRKASHPGPRCATHWRAEVKRRKAANHDKYVQDSYGLAEGDYEALYVFQGGRCAICQRNRGVVKRLAVDHNHKTSEVRGLLCGPCNSMLAHARDDADMFRRAHNYLWNPPAVKARQDGVLGEASEVPDVWKGGTANRNWKVSHPRPKG